MPDDDFLFRRYADVGSPVQGSDVTDGQLFSVLDPGRDRLIALFKTVINQELGHSTTSVLASSVWGVVRTGTALASVQPVQDTIYQAPTRGLFKTTTWQYPLLAVYRMGDAPHDEFTLQTERITQQWGLDYILGPLQAADQRKLMAALHGAKVFISIAIRKRGHPAFEGGKLQFGEGDGRFSKIRVVTSTEGPASYGEDGDGVEFQALHMVLETEELDGAFDEELEAAFEGVTGTFGVGGSEGILPDAIIARSEILPDPTHGKPQP